VPPAESGDFQDIPAWRTLTAEFALTLRADYQRPLIVPMTVVNAAYREEIFGRIGKAGERIVHVFLEVPAEELRRRIDAQVLMEDNPELDALLPRVPAQQRRTLRRGTGRPARGHARPAQ
jgi:hypothetical protein